MTEEPEKAANGGKLSKWLKKPWAIVVAVATVVGVFFLNINTVLTNVRAFPTEVGKTSSQFSSWYYDDGAWSGYWTSNPEAYVDLADMKLSHTPVGVLLHVENGRIDGSISNQRVCAAFPFFDFVLLRGHVDTFGNSATVIAWDTIEGHDRDFAKLKLTIDDGVMTIEPVEGAVELFPKARVALDPNVKDWPSEFCEGKRAAMIKILEKVLKEERAKNPSVQQPTRSIWCGPPALVCGR